MVLTPSGGGSRRVFIDQFLCSQVPYLRFYACAWYALEKGFLNNVQAIESWPLLYLVMNDDEYISESHLSPLYISKFQNFINGCHRRTSPSNQSIYYRHYLMRTFASEALLLLCLLWVRWCGFPKLRYQQIHSGLLQIIWMEMVSTPASLHWPL